MAPSEEQHLGNQVAGLIAELHAFRENWEKQDIRANESRKFLYDRMETVAKEVQKLTHDLLTVMQDVAELQPAVRDWVEQKARAEGASAIVKYLVRSLWMVGGAIVTIIVWVFSHYTTFPHVAP